MLNHTGTVEIHTERLVLRRFFMGDAQSMYDNYCTDEDVTRYVTWEPHANLQETMELLALWTGEYEQPDKYNWAIEYEGEVIGGIGCASVKEKQKSAEFGYCIAKEHWGKGIVTEAARAVIAHLFDTVGLNRIEARHDVLNPASGAVMRKVGMTKEGCLRQQELRKDGSFGDHDIYSILREEYLAMQGTAK